jgi:WD40-like Beta Propeller Repeat
VTRGLLLAVVVVFVFGPSATARIDHREAPVRTLAEVPGRADALAASGSRIAWINTRARCGRQVQILTLPRRRPVYVGSASGRSCRRANIGAIAVAAGGRVLWQRLVGGGLTVLDVEVDTAALRAPRTDVVGTVEFLYSQADPDYVEPWPLLTASDGNSIVFYASCVGSCGRGFKGNAVYRLAERRARRLASVSTNPVGIALAGRRYAVANKSALCCNDAPAWSRDGTRLAWIYRENLWTIGADGMGDRLLATRAALPSWAPEGTRLVFEREEARDRRAVYRIDFAGGGLRRLAAGAAPVWSPDGTKIAFVRGRDVYTIDPDGQAEQKLTATARATVGPLSWSPDSTRIAVSRGGAVYSIRADGAGEARLATGAQPAWSPDGAKIAYTADGIRVASADGTGAVRLTRGTDGMPAWSPDSARIAFIRNPTTGGQLWVTSLDGGRERRLAGSSQLASPQWVPNGSSITVADYHGDGAFPDDAGIHVVPAGGGKPARIAPALHTSVEIRDAVTGRLIKRLTIDGHARSIALDPGYLAALVDHHPGVRVELFDPNGRLRKSAAVPSSIRSISASGRSVVFAAGRAIRRVDAGTGAVSTLATARGRLVGPVIENRRVVWGENLGRSARIRAVTVP